MQIFEKIRPTDSIAKSSLINVAIKPLSLLISIFYTPLLLIYLGDEKYGLWATVLSIISWINYFDVGIGNGLRNILPKFLIKKDYNSVNKAISTAYIVLTLIAGGLLILLIIGTFNINWYYVFSTEVDLKCVMVISFTFICINFVLSLGNTLLYALQLSERVAIRNFLAQIYNCIGIIVLSRISSGNLIYVSILFGLSQFAVNVYNTFQVIHKNNYLRPSVKNYDRRLLKSIFNVGMKFFVIQLMCLAMFTVDDLLITHYWGATVNTPFNITNKFFNTIYSIFAALTLPYWSGTTKAISTNNVLWIEKSVKKIIKILLIFVVVFLIAVIMFKPMVKMWLGKELEFQTGLIPLMGLFYLFYSLLNLECQFLNGMNVTKLQMKLYIFSGIINIPFSILLGVTFGLKSVGVRLATLILVAIMDLFLGLDLRRSIISINKRS